MFLNRDIPIQLAQFGSIHTATGSLMTFSLENFNCLIGEGVHSLYFQKAGDLFKKYSSLLYSRGVLRALVKQYGIIMIDDHHGQRSGLAMHPGNHYSDSKGCVLPCLMANISNADIATAYSVDALVKIYNYLISSKDMILEIRQLDLGIQ